MAQFSRVALNKILHESDNGKSGISDRERELFGLSSERQRCLINNICALGRVNYLEIGVYRGATIISAMKNNKQCSATGIENFSYDDREPKKYAPEGFIWDNMKSQLETTIEKYHDQDSGVDVKKLTIIEDDFREIDFSGMAKFNVCHFDLAPVKEGDYEIFFEKVFPQLAKESVIIFTNYSDESVSSQLHSTLDKYSEEYTEIFSAKRISASTSDSTFYHSGILLLAINKKG